MDAGALDGLAGAAPPPGGRFSEERTFVVPSRRRVPLLWMVVLASSVLSIIGVVVWASGYSGRIEARVIHRLQGDRLRLHTVGASDIVSVRIAGRDYMVRQQHVELPVVDGLLKPGRQFLKLQARRRSGETRSYDVAVAVDFLLSAEVGGLSDDAPSFALRVVAPRQAKVRIDGTAVALDAQGVGRKVYVVNVADHDAAAQDWRRSIPYEVALGPKTRVTGRLAVRLPYAALDFQGPGIELTTDVDRLVIEAKVAPQANVLIDGHVVPTVRGQLRYVMMLQRLGLSTPVLVVRQPGSLPRQVNLRLQRVASVAKEIDAYAPTAAMDYAALRSVPETFRGQKVRFEARVYNRQVRQGRSVVQVLVHPCQLVEGCAVWVTYPAVSLAGVEDWVRVAGRIAGSQQFHDASGQVLTVPRVDADFVVPGVAPARP